MWFLPERLTEGGGGDTLAATGFLDATSNLTRSISSFNGYTGERINASRCCRMAFDSDGRGGPQWKIVDVGAVLLEPVSWVLVKVRTDEGITGIGEAYHGAGVHHIAVDERLTQRAPHRPRPAQR